MLGGCHAFFGSKMVKNVWQLPCDIWIENSKKCLAAIRCFLDGKCFKMLGGHHSFSRSKMLENT
jgi:hypothetical protein